VGRRAKEGTMAWDRLSGGGRCQASAVRHITFYTRRGCHLCEEAWEIVAAAQRRHGFTVTTIDVDTDATLAAEYGECVPVVAIDGRVRFRGQVNAVLLERILRRP
jgi:glutaredoxin